MCFCLSMLLSCFGASIVKVRMAKWKRFFIFFPPSFPFMIFLSLFFACEMLSLHMSLHLLRQDTNKSFHVSCLGARCIKVNIIWQPSTLLCFAYFQSFSFSLLSLSIPAGGKKKKVSQSVLIRLLLRYLPTFSSTMNASLGLDEY